MSEGDAASASEGQGAPEERVHPAEPALTSSSANDDNEEDILRSLRRITRAIDLHSRKLANRFGLTGPQLVCLRAVARQGTVTASALARDVSLSGATVFGFLDRLAARQLITRERSTKDRRQVVAELTEAGRALIEQAPSPLQERFVSRLGALPMAEQLRLRDTLRSIVEMMDGEELDAEPVLSPDGAGDPTELEQIMELPPEQTE